jgi:hypothetical protein
MEAADMATRFQAIPRAAYAPVKPEMRLKYQAHVENAPMAAFVDDEVARLAALKELEDDLASAFADSQDPSRPCTYRVHK